MANGSEILTYGPRVQFAVQGIQPPSNLYIGRNDSLVVDWWDRHGLGAEINGRILRPDGEISPFSRDLVTSGTLGNRNRLRIELTEGFLLSVCAKPLTAIEPARGQLFIRAVLWRGTLDVGAPVLTVISDYVTADYYPSWPYAPIFNSLDGRGRVAGVAVANPPAGADWSYTLAAGQYWRLIGFRARLVTDANVATRIPSFEILPGGFFSIQSRGTNAHTASSTFDYVAGDYGIRSGAGEAVQYIPIPSDIRLREGDVLRVATAAIQVGDQWSQIVISAEEWIADY